jgi:uncharacterized protein YndB with AHSA1/START domain
MAKIRLTKWIDAPPELVFSLWTDVSRMAEWIEGLSKVTDQTGPLDRVGTTYVTWFGRISGRNEVLAAEPPRRIRTRLGNWLLRGETEASFAAERGGTLVTQIFETQGIVPSIAARIFAMGSYKGSFRGELNTFARLAEREARMRGAGA